MPTARASSILLEPSASGKLERRELKLPTRHRLRRWSSRPTASSSGFTLARPDAPADAYSLDLDSGQLTRWTYSEVGGLDPATFVTAERIRFPSFDGREDSRPGITSRGPPRPRTRPRC